MNNKNRAPVRLAIGGESWNGWTFGPYGRSREWRINAPGGCCYTAKELVDLRGLCLSIDYLQVRIRKIERDLAEARKNEAFYRRQVVMEAKLGLALFPSNPLDSHRLQDVVSKRPVMYDLMGLPLDA